MRDEKPFFRNPWVITIIIIDILVLLVIIGIMIFNATKTATLSFNIAPVDATISVNGNKNYHNGTFKIHPGEYDITISKDGLTSKTFHFNLNSNSSASLITFLSGADNTNNTDNANNNLAFYERKENYPSLEKLISIAGKNNNLTTDRDSSAEAFVEDMSKNLTLYETVLPITERNRENTDDNGGYLASLTSLEKSNSKKCEKTLCIEAGGFGTLNNNTVNTILETAGFKTEYLEIIYE